MKGGRQYKTWERNIGAPERYDGPRPADLERSDDEEYANDFALVVDFLKDGRDGMANREKYHVWICQLMNRGAMLSTEQFLEDFRISYGDVSLYRAAAKALELHAQNGKAA